MEHDRATAFDAFERALAVSPSSAFTLFLGSVALAWGGEADRAIDWAQRALRVSPLDRLIFMPYHGLAAAYFLRGEYEEAAKFASRAIQSNPTFSVSRSLLVAPLVRLGRVEEAKAAAHSLLELQPHFSGSGFCAAIGVPPVLAKPLTDAWREAGLPA
jgi:tetratricopeptide (TPR) repeat protein